MDTDHIKNYVILRELMMDLWRRDKELYNRVNPFCESLVNWKEKGRFCTGKESVTVYDSATIIGDVDIGEHSWIGPFCIIDGGGGVKIGEYVSVAAGCQIMSHDSIKWALSGGKREYEYGPIEIGSCCFIGTLSVILKNVTIGEHCLVGANSLVVDSFNPYSIIVGVPAKKVGYVVVAGDEVELVWH